MWFHYYSTAYGGSSTGVSERRSKFRTIRRRRNDSIVVQVYREIAWRSPESGFGWIKRKTDRLGADIYTLGRLLGHDRSKCWIIFNTVGRKIWQVYPHDKIDFLSFYISCNYDRVCVFFSELNWKILKAVSLMLYFS